MTFQLIPFCLGFFIGTAIPGLVFIAGFEFIDWLMKPRIKKKPRDAADHSVLDRGDGA